MQKLILCCNGSPGENVVLTAVVRDLHEMFRNQYLTDIRTPYPELWENNPYVTGLSEHAGGVRTIQCESPLAGGSRESRGHRIEAMTRFLGHELGVALTPSFLKGDIYLSETERWVPPPGIGFSDEERPFWLICTGGKRECTIKWWDRSRYQEVVDHFRGRIQFVQVGAVGDYHPELDGVIDLRAKTSLRQLVRLVYHAEGVVTPTNLLMHLAAALELKTDPSYGQSILRACIVVAGGREPAHWAAYPMHRFLDTIGRFHCCRTGGCWRSRVTPLGDRSRFEQPENLCVDVVQGRPRCMDVITATDVVCAIEEDILARAPRGRAENAKGGHAERSRRPNGRILHVYSEYDSESEETRRRYSLAQRSWSAALTIRSRGVRPAETRQFDDGVRHLPYIKDLVEVALREFAAEEGDILLLTNADTIIAYNFEERIRIRMLQVGDAVYSFRRDFPRLTKLIAPEQIRLGSFYWGCDLFAFTAAWWREHADEYPDLLLGAEAWDACLRALMMKYASGNCDFDDLIYHEKHESVWEAAANFNTLPSQRYNRKLAKPFLMANGMYGDSWPDEPKI